MGKRMRVGMRIRKLRQAMGLRQVDLAKALGVSQAQVSRFEHGSRACSYYAADGLAEVFDRPVEEFLSPQAIRRLRRART